MCRFRAVLLTLASLVLASGIDAQTNSSTEHIPAIGARVRLMAPALGADWQIGMFNRLRVEPPCYLILLFEPGRTRRIRATVSIRDITRLQVSTLYDGRERLEPAEPTADTYVNESWRDVSLDAVRAADQLCRVRNGPGPSEKEGSP